MRGPTMHGRHLILLLCLFAAAPGQAGEVQLHKQAETVKVLVDGQVFGVYYFGPQWKKPFFSTVTAPGAMEALKEGLDVAPPDEFAPGNRVIVAQEQAELTRDDKPVGQAALDEELVVSQARDGRLFVPAKEAWISEADVAPVKGLVTRIVNLDPPVGKDRLHPQYYDHPHHKGVWLSIDEVNDIRFWAEDGRIAVQSVDVVTPTGNPAELRVVSHWLGEDDRPVVIEETTIRFFANRLCAYDITFTGGESGATFGDTKEGLFAIRLPNSMRELAGGGPVVNAAGEQGTKALWGQPTPWIDYCGPVAGRMLGVTLMDDPRNFRPSRYHVRDYGLFSINPFGDKSYTGGKVDTPPVMLKPGESLHLRYGLYVHAGDTTAAEVPQAYEQFVGSGK